MLAAEKSLQRSIYVSSSRERSLQASCSVPCQHTNAPHAAPTTAGACLPPFSYGMTTYASLYVTCSHYCEMIAGRNGRIGCRSRPCCITVVHEQLYGAEADLLQSCRGQGSAPCSRTVRNASMSQTKWILGGCDSL